jgi:hypothetical protein
MLSSSQVNNRYSMQFTGTSKQGLDELLCVSSNNADIKGIYYGDIGNFENDAGVFATSLASTEYEYADVIPGPSLERGSAAASHSAATNRIPASHHPPCVRCTLSETRCARRRWMRPAPPLEDFCLCRRRGSTVFVWRRTMATSWSRHARTRASERRQTAPKILARFGSQN